MPAGTVTLSEKHKIVLRRFSLGDYEDQEIYAQQVVYEWLQTDTGKWCKENASDILLESYVEYDSFYIEYMITGQLTESQYAYFLMKYGKQEKNYENR